MDNKTKNYVKSLVRSFNGDIEKTAKFLRDSLKIAGLKECRALVTEAMV